MGCANETNCRGLLQRPRPSPRVWSLNFRFADQLLGTASDAANSVLPVNSTASPVRSLRELPFPCQLLNVVARIALVAAHDAVSWRRQVRKWHLDEHETRHLSAKVFPGLRRLRKGASARYSPASPMVWLY